MLFGLRTENWYVQTSDPILLGITLLIPWILQNPEARKSLPGIAFGDYGRRYQAPTLEEGFEDIIPIEFEFTGTEEEKKLWGQYWV